MAGFSVRTNLVVAWGAIVGMVWSLGLPWFGSSPPAPKEAVYGISSVQGAIGDLEREFTASGTSAWTTISMESRVLVLLAIIATIGVLFCLSPKAAEFGRIVLHGATFAVLGVVLFRMFDQPGTNAVVELRYGIWVALGFAVIAFRAAHSIHPRSYAQASFVAAQHTKTLLPPS